MMSHLRLHKECLRMLADKEEVGQKHIWVVKLTIAKSIKDEANGRRGVVDAISMLFPGLSHFD